MILLPYAVLSACALGACWFLVRRRKPLDNPCSDFTEPLNMNQRIRLIDACGPDCTCLGNGSEHVGGGN